MGTVLFISLLPSYPKDRWGFKFLVSSLCRLIGFRSTAELREKKVAWLW